MMFSTNAVAILSMWNLVFIPSLLQTEAMKASPHPFIVEQDGESITLKIKGDEHQHWVTDEEDYTVIQNNKGYFMYAELSADESSLVPSDEKAGTSGKLPKSKDLKPPKKKHFSDENDEIYLTGSPALVTHPNNPGRRKQCERDGDLRCSKLFRKGKRVNQNAVEMGTTKFHDRRNLKTATTESLQNLVILLMFNDHKNRRVPSKEEISVLMNSEVIDRALAPTGSLKMIYWENSYGKLTINSTVTDWIVLDKDERYYANGNSGLGYRFHEALKYALDELESNDYPFENFDQDGDRLSNIDCISFLTSGYGAEWGGGDYQDRIWSHKWGIPRGWQSQRTGVRVTNYYVSPALWGTSGAQIGRVGVIAHEIGHYLDLPDLYDTDTSGGYGIGWFGLMSNSWGYDGSQLYPPHLSGWSKMKLGWTNPTSPIVGIENYVGRSEGNSTANRLYKIGDGNFGFPSGEYLLIEYRKPEWLIGGIAIYHIDEQTESYNNEGFPGQNGWPYNGLHYKVALLPADKAYELERGINQGHSKDLYSVGQSLLPSNGTDGPFPNTDAYQNRLVTPTGVRLCVTSDNQGDDMSFLFSDGSITPWITILSETFEEELNEAIVLGKRATVVENNRCKDSFCVGMKVEESSSVLATVGTTCMNTLKVSFEFYFIRLKNNEALILEFGPHNREEDADWVTLGHWTKKKRVRKNRTWFSHTTEFLLDVNTMSETEATTAMLRFRTNSTKGKIFIDNLVVEGRF